MNRYKNPFKLVYEQMNSVACGNASVPEFPLLIDIEITSHCNLKCIMCDHTYINGKQEMMSEDVFNTIIEQCKPYKPAIRFLMFSEPFLHPKILQFAETVKDSDFLLHVTTNGTIITTEHIDELIKLGLDSITFSMQGATEKEYAFIRRNDKLPLITERIKYLSTKRQTTPFIHVSTTVSKRDLQEDIEKFKEKWNKYADLVTVGITVWDRVLEYRPEIFKDLGISPDINKKYVPCPDVKGKMCFLPNGDITVCCADPEGKLVMGNVLMDNPKETWHSDAYKGIRLILQNMRMDLLDPCKNCYPAYDFTK